MVPAKELHQQGMTVEDENDDDGEEQPFGTALQCVIHFVVLCFEKATVT